MNAIDPLFSATRWRRLATAGLLLALGACSALKPAATPHPSFHVLDGDAAAGSVAAPPAPASAPTLIVNPPHAAAGFDSQRIIYVREAHRLEYFAHNEWVDPPARMLAPLLVAAIGHSGAFRAVLPTPSAAAGEMRLDTEIIRLQHEFGTPPSRVRFTLRAVLVDEKTRRVLAWREFDTSVTADSEDPRGGVVAANRAVRNVLAQLSTFCAETARRAPPAK